MTDSVLTFVLFRRWLANGSDLVRMLSPSTLTCSGTLTPLGNSSIQPVVSAVAVRTKFVGLVSAPDVGTLLICHFPATSASESGAGAGAGAIAAVVVSAGGASLFAHAATSRMVEPARARRVMRCMEPSATR